MPGGRPPIYDMIEQAKALEEWSKKDDSTALCQFCVEQDIYPDYIYDWRDKSPEFSTALKKAKTRIASRLRKMLNAGTTNYGLFMAELGFHDKFYHDYQESLKDAHANRSKDIEGSKKTTYNIMVPNGLATGSNIPAEGLSVTPSKGSK